MKQIKMAILVSLLFGLSTGWVGCHKNQDTEQAGTAQQQMPPAVVNTINVQPQTIPNVQTFSGRTTAYQQADVRPQVNGIVDEVLFKEGSVVKKGQPLYRINTDNYNSAVSSNEAAVAQAKANVVTSKAAYNNAVAELNSRQANLKQAQSDLKRLKGLVAIDAISKQQFEQAQTAYLNAAAAVASAKASVAQAQAGISSANANVSAAESGLSASQLDLNRTIVRAPINGRSDRSNVTAGALVNANQQQPLVTISQLDPIYVDISQSSSELIKLKQQIASGKAKPGVNKVQLVLEDGSTYPVEGQLALAEAQVNADTGAVTLRAVFPNPNRILLPGMFVNAKLIQSVTTNAILLPQSAVMRTPKGDAQVYVVDANKKIKIKPVQIDGTYQDDWIITDGLTAGDNVVVIGGAKIKPDQQVVVKPLPGKNSGDAAATNTQENKQDYPKQTTIQAPKTPQQAASTYQQNSANTADSDLTNNPNQRTATNQNQSQSTTAK